LSSNKTITKNTSTNYASKAITKAHVDAVEAVSTQFYVSFDRKLKVSTIIYQLILRKNAIERM